MTSLIKADTITLDQVGSDIKNKIWEMEALGKSLPMMTVEEARNTELAQIEIKIEHHFSLGIYARTMYMPKNAVIVGKLHKYPQLNILSQGEVTVRSGDEIKRVKAPYIYSAPAGTKRILYAYEDVVWTTILGTNETDVEKIEHQFITETEQEYIDFCYQQNHELEINLAKFDKACLEDRSKDNV